MSDELYRKLPNLFFTARQLMRSRVRGAGKTDPNNWMRLETLRFVDGREAVTMLEVARYLRVTAPSATSLIRGLVSRGLVRRTTDKRDKRVVHLSLSKKGERLLADYVRNSSDIMREVFSKLSMQDVRELERILRLLHDAHTA